MVIGIDIRALTGQTGGIPEYTRNLVTALLSGETRHFYVLFTNAARGSDPFPFASRGPRHQVCALRYPNKILHASLCLFGRPHIDELVYRHTGIRVDLLFFPNVHFLAYSPRVPAVVTVHDLSFLHYSDLFSWKGRMWHRLIRPEHVYARATHLCAVSEWTRHDLEMSYGTNRARITVTPLDCAEEFGQGAVEDDGDSTRNLILLFGADNPRKNTGGVCEAWSDVCRHLPSLAGKYTLVLIGRDCTRIQRMVRQSACAHAPIRVRGLVSNEERLLLYRGAGALMYPSIMEGFGIPLLEAARTRVPIIAANHSSIGEVIGTGAYYVDPYSRTDMSKALHEVLTDAPLRTALVNDAETAAQRFSWQKTAERTRAVCEYTYDHWH